VMHHVGTNDYRHIDTSTVDSRLATRIFVTFQAIGGSSLRRGFSDLCHKKQLLKVLNG